MGYSQRIAVTGLNAGDNLAPAAGVIRSLRAEPSFTGAVLGLAYDVMEAGIHVAGLVDAVCLLSYPSQGLGALQSRLTLADEMAKIDVLIPNLDSELLSFIRLAPFLRARQIQTLLPTEEQLEARAKVNLPGLTDRCGVEVPKTRVVFDRYAASLGIENGLFPVVVKGSFCGAYVAYTPAQAAGYFDELSAQWGLPIIVQEYLVGVEVDVAVLGSGEGAMVGAVAMRKQALSEKGKAWGGVTIHDPELIALAQTVTEGLAWRGPMELEVLKAERDGQWYLIEINPRFPSWIALAQAAGQNLPVAAMQLALGEVVTPMSVYTAGVRFVRASQDHICDPGEVERLVTVGTIKREVCIERTI